MAKRAHQHRPGSRGETGEAKQQADKAPEKDVLFAYMPYHKLTHPALGASILKACLERKGISARVAYYGIRFAERIGTERYQSLLNSLTPKLRAERTFVEAAFGEAFFKERQDAIGREYPWDDEDLQEVATEAKQWVSEIVDEICANPPRILICSSMFQQNLASLAVLRGVKEHCPRIKTIMGGPNTEGILGIGLLRRASWLDYICGGEGEETLPELCRQLLSGTKDEMSPVGVISQTQLAEFEGRFDASPARPSLNNMDASPAPCFDDFFAALSRTSLALEPGLLLESSRGCWWGQRSHCTFCGLNGEGMTYRARNPEAMKGIVETTTKRYGINKVEFVDNIIAKSYFEEFLPLLSERNLTLFYETKADFSEGDAQRFYNSGVRFIQPGIESLSDPVLKLMRKGTSAAMNIECLRMCREYGIRPAWSILSAFPGEEAIWYKETSDIIPLLSHLPPPNGIIPIRFDRFSPYHDNPSAWQLELEPFEAYRHLYPAYRGQHDDIAYFFKKKGRDELTDDGLEAWGQWHWACRELVKEWQSFWSERRKTGAEHPRLYLEQTNGWHIHDDRKSDRTPIKTAVSDAMHKLLLTCRQRQSDAQLKRIIGEQAHIRTEDELQSLLEEATAQGWILRISNQWITLVQIYNHQQLPIRQWPGGIVLEKHPPESRRIGTGSGNRQANRSGATAMQPRR
jgi:magnesium-protoporphyrin IX monomethyl ester (oxidative) cyclase